MKSDYNLDLGNASSVKCGMKLGTKLSDLDAKWVEKWFELKCKDVNSDHVVEDVIVKFYSKFWTNVENNTIVGDSQLQVLYDGTKGYTHDSLIFELKDNIEMSNILDKEGSLMQMATTSPDQQNGQSDLFDLLNPDGWKNKPDALNSSFSSSQLKPPSDISRHFQSKAPQAEIKDANIPLKNRMPKVYFLRRWLTEFDGLKDCNKEIAKGVEHKWQG